MAASKKPVPAKKVSATPKPVKAADVIKGQGYMPAQKTRGSLFGRKGPQRKGGK